MRFLVAGSSGFLGGALCRRLGEDGHDVTRLVRRPAQAGEASWDPSSPDLDELARIVDRHEVVVNLAGSPTFGNPYSHRWAAELARSRVTTTGVLAKAIARARNRPAYLAGNGISYYGDHGDAPLTERADTRGDALLTRVTRVWQRATEPATAAGARVVVLRTSPVLDRRSAPLKLLRPLFAAGLGGRLGSGAQYFPVISLRDWVGAVVHAAGDERVSGPVNLCCTSVPNNAEFTRALATQLHRPAYLSVPGPVIRAAMGPMAAEVLGSLRTVPQALLDSGYTFADPDIEAVLSTGLGRWCGSRALRMGRWSRQDRPRRTLGGVSNLEVRELGSLDYTAAWERQRDVHASVVAGGPGTVLLLEHPPVFTCGKRTDAQERPADPGGAQVIDVDRGGKITFHGPGQLVGYPIVRLPDHVLVVDYVRRLEEALIATCRELGVESARVPGRSGVWLAETPARPERKIGAIGIRVSRGVTMHGFALNCNVDLGWYDRFVPCGISDAGVTSLSAELGRDITVPAVVPIAERHLRELLAWAPYDATPDYPAKPEPPHGPRVPVLSR